MSTVPGKRPATYEDLFDLPEHVVGEIVNGELVVSPRPAPRHASASSELGGELCFRFGRGGGDAERPGGWRILDEPELHLGEHILVPDMAGWRRERLPRLPEEAYFTLPPDWLCEVLSPSTVGIDRVRKMPIYLEHGIDFVWLVHPGDRTLEVYRREEGRWIVAASFQGEQTVRAEPFDAVEIELCHLWED